MSTTLTPIPARSIHDLSEIMLKAADRIEDEGWWAAGDRSKGNGTICALIAIGDVLRRLKREDDIERVATSFAQYLGLSTSADVATWNDHQPDGETVVRIMRAAADSAL